jgi:hypothetical protein
MEKRGKPFKPGNKFGRGRPTGRRNKRTLIIRELEEHSAALLAKGLAMALEGDARMIRTFLGYILPKDPPVKTGRLRMDTIEELVQTHQNLAKKVGSGQLTPSEARKIDSLIETRCWLIETQDMERRVRAVEQLVAKDGDWAV